MTSPAPAGWYPDPSGTPGHRWWDGHAWSTSTMPLATAPASPIPQVPVPAAPQPMAAAQQVATVGAQPAAFGTPNPQFGQSPYTYPSAPQAPQYRSAAAASNRLALTTFAVVAIYIAIAVLTHFVVLGILPLGLSLRSKRLGEPLAPFAIGAAALAIVVAAIAIFGH